jgi:hypothetical protein
VLSEMVAFQTRNSMTYPPKFAAKGKCKSAKCSVTQPSLFKAPLCYSRALIIHSLLSVEKKAL